MPSYNESKITTSDDFYKFRSELDIQEFNDLEACIKKGRLKLGTTPLGAILECLRYSIETVEHFIGEEFYRTKDCDIQDTFPADSPDYEDRIHEFLLAYHTPEKDQRQRCYDELLDQEEKWCCKPIFQIMYQEKAWINESYYAFGFKPDSPACLFQNTNVKTLAELVADWHASQKTHKKWNPQYVHVEMTTRIMEYCRTHKPEEILTNFDLKLKGNNRSFIYPFDGWTLAECLRISYSRK